MPTRHPQPGAIEVRGARVHNLKNVSLDIPLGEFVGIAGVSGSGKSSLALTRHPQPGAIEVRGARVHNLKNVSLDIPLGEFVGIAGVSGSGKSSLALGVLYAEGSRRYLEALSTYTRRRLTQAAKASVDEVLYVPAALALHQRPAVPGIRSTFGTSTELLNSLRLLFSAAKASVDEVLYVPAALALHQRPAVPGIRSTFGTSTELLNSLRLLFSRLGSHVCPNGHRCPPTMDVALDKPIECPTCGAQFYGPSAEDLSFNSGGACPTCEGTGIVRRVDESTLVPDESLTIDEGAVAPWGQLMWSLMKDVCREMGVRTDVPFKDLTPHEKDIVFHGPAEKKHILYHNKNNDTYSELDFTYFNAVYTVENALSKAKDEKALARVAKFLSEQPCPDCHGTRLSVKARSSTVCGINLAQATEKTLDELVAWVPTVPPSLPGELQPMARSIVDTLSEPAARLQQLGLGYLSLDRAGSTLSTGERQRVQLARAVRNRTTGVLYVLDEPSIGLHPVNVDGLLAVIDDLLADGNSVVTVDHDVQVLRAVDHLIEVGPGSGANGGTIVAQGSVEQVEKTPGTRIGGFLDGTRRVRVRERMAQGTMFEHGAIALETSQIHTVHPLELAIPQGRLVAVTGVSGSGKTTLVLESLLPALRARLANHKLPAHLVSFDAPGIKRCDLIDATPIGANVRSTVATYSGVLDDLRRAFAKTADAKAKGLKAGDFSYNTGSLRCPTCDGTGQISLDVQFLPDVTIECPDCGQFLPDVTIECPDCGGSRYASEAYGIRRPVKGSTDDISLPELLRCTVDEAIPLVNGLRTAEAKLHTLSDLGLGYLTLGEATPALSGGEAQRLKLASEIGRDQSDALYVFDEPLSGGEAQRLKLASEIGRDQSDALYVFDEPTIGLHPLDVAVLLGVLQRLVDGGATVVVIEHDLDVIANADWIVDMGPGGGVGGGRIVCTGTNADWIVDMGPGGGVGGGRIVCTGTPEEVAANPESVTGRYLARELG